MQEILNFLLYVGQYHGSLLLIKRMQLIRDMIKIERNTSYAEIRRSRETIQKSGAKNE